MIWGRILWTYLEEVLAMRAQGTCVVGRHKLGSQTRTKTAGEEARPNMNKYLDWLLSPSECDQSDIQAPLHANFSQALSPRPF